MYCFGDIWCQSNSSALWVIVIFFFFFLKKLWGLSPLSLKSAGITSMYLRLHCCWSISEASGEPFRGAHSALLELRISSHSLPYSHRFHSFFLFSTDSDYVCVVSFLPASHFNHIPPDPCCFSVLVSVTLQVVPALPQCSLFNVMWIFSSSKILKFNLNFRDSFIIFFQVSRVY